MATQILPINPGSDGDGRRRPRTDDYIRNDEHYLDRVGLQWAKDQGLPTGPQYRLDKLPHGYGGYEKPRATDPKHVDRYVYGHPVGVFRSVNEFFPHFKHLMDHGNAYGCPCKCCTGSGPKKGPSVRSVDDSGVSQTGNSAKMSPYFAQPASSVRAPQSMSAVPRGRDLLGMSESRSPQPRPRKKQVDEEGTPDVYRTLIDRLKTIGPDEKIDELIIESMSPDWRVDHVRLSKELKEWRALPAYVPRKGELVLFARHLVDYETLVWDSAAQTFRAYDTATQIWGEIPGWEVGVVTQMPLEPVGDEDLTKMPSTKEQNVTLSGFRVEPLPQVDSKTKSLTRQHKYLPLHALRPLCFWQECLRSISEQDWHPTVRHALAVSNTMVTISKYHFKGQWPEATIFCQGAYIGPEFVQLGDAVRLHPRSVDKQEVTDVMVVSAIKMRLVNLDEANDDDWDDSQPYNTCTHFSGRTYTQDPARSYDGIGKSPIPEDSEFLHPSMRGHGTWYYVCEPKKDKARIEVPYTRIIGRCYEAAALKAWFSPPSGVSPPQAPSGFQAVNAAPRATDSSVSASSLQTINSGLTGIMAARQYGYDHNPRIDKAAGKSWYWADTRIEALDVHVVNDRSVSSHDPNRDAQQMNDWRRALRALDGKKGGLEEYHAARRHRELEQKRREAELAGTGSGLVAAGAQAAAGVESGLGTEPVTEAEGTGESDDMLQDGMEVEFATAAKGVIPPKSDEDDSDMEVDELGGNALAAFKAGASGNAVKNPTEVVEIDDDDDDDD
ncbi:hypothetical protein NU195Hw_g4580t1 [Hortaea werneckii]